MQNSFIVLNFAFQFMNSYITLFYYCFFAGATSFGLDLTVTDNVFDKERFETVMRYLVTFFATKAILGVVKVTNNNLYSLDTHLKQGNLVPYLQYKAKDKLFQKKYYEAMKKKGSDFQAKVAASFTQIQLNIQTEVN